MGREAFSLVGGQGRLEPLTDPLQLLLQRLAEAQVPGGN
jgi:hypothetical protein